MLEMRVKNHNKKEKTIFKFSNNYILNTLAALTECEECGNDIPVERQRYGSVTLCVECKNTQEKLSKRYF